MERNYASNMDIPGKPGTDVKTYVIVDNGTRWAAGDAIRKHRVPQDLNDYIIEKAAKLCSPVFIFTRNDNGWIVRIGLDGYCPNSMPSQKVIDRLAAMGIKMYLDSVNHCLAIDFLMNAKLDLRAPK